MLLLVRHDWIDRWSYESSEVDDSILLPDQLAAARSGL